MLPICSSPNILKLKTSLEFHCIQDIIARVVHHWQSTSYNLFINIEHLNYVYNVMLLSYNFFFTKKPKKLTLNLFYMISCKIAFSVLYCKCILETIMQGIHHSFLMEKWGRD